MGCQHGLHAPLSTAKDDSQYVGIVTDSTSGACKTIIFPAGWISPNPQRCWWENLCVFTRLNQTPCNWTKNSKWLKIQLFRVSCFLGLKPVLNWCSRRLEETLILHGKNTGKNCKKKQCLLGKSTCFFLVCYSCVEWWNPHHQTAPAAEIPR